MLPCGGAPALGAPPTLITAQAKLFCLVPLVMLLSGAQPGLTPPGRSLAEGRGRVREAHSKGEAGLRGNGTGGRGHKVAVRIS